MAFTISSLACYDVITRTRGPSLVDPPQTAIEHYVIESIKAIKPIF